MENNVINPMIVASKYCKTLFFYSLLNINWKIFFYQLTLNQQKKYQKMTVPKAEILYLYTCFEKYSKGKPKLKIKNLLEGCEEQVSFLPFISSFDLRKDSSLEFEEFLELLGITIRSTLQKRLEGK